MRAKNLLIIGDDLTGSNDSAVMFADFGYKTLLHTNAINTSNLEFAGNSVISINASTRADYKNAYEITCKLVENAIASNVESIYLKIDSTMRGSVNEQIKGAISAWKNKYSNAKAIVSCSYPAMGRSIIDGVLYVNGTKVTQTASGKDPFCPVKSDFFKDLLPNSLILKNSSPNELVKQINNASEDIIVIDSSSDQELENIAIAIEHIGASCIPVGSAGLASKIRLDATIEKKDNNIHSLGKILLVVSSLHDASQKQADLYLRNSNGNCTSFVPLTGQLMSSPKSFDLLLQEVGNIAKISKANMMILSDAAHLECGKEIVSTSKQIATRLAILAGKAFSEGNFDTVFIVGGDGANAFLEYSNTSSLSIKNSLASGVPLCIMNNGSYAGKKIITKSGGFGDTDLLLKILV